METVYEGRYVRFSTTSKKDAAVLLGADTLVGDFFTVSLRVEKGRSIAWLTNRFGADTGYLDSEATRMVQLAEARGWTTKALLSFIAYSDNPDLGEYWGEMALFCYDPAYEAEFSAFARTLSDRLSEGARPDIFLSQQGIEKVLGTKGEWFPSSTVPLPEKRTGTVIMKSKRSLSEKLVEQSRKGNVGCYVVGWAFILALVALAAFGLKHLGFF